MNVNEKTALLPKLTVDVDSIEDGQASNNNLWLGLTRQEIIESSKDPFWCRLRLLLFINFWIILAAMMAVAIGILATSPGCSPAIPTLETIIDLKPVIQQYSSFPEVSQLVQN